MNNGTKPTVKPMTQLPKTKQVKNETVHSAFTDQRSRHYHDTVLAQADNTRPIKRLNPTKTKPNSMTETAYPGLAN
jgi:hypothetical protein